VTAPADDTCGAEGPDGLRCVLPGRCAPGRDHIAQGRAWPAGPPREPSPEEMARRVCAALFDEEHGTPHAFQAVVDILTAERARAEGETTALREEVARLVHMSPADRNMESYGRSLALRAFLDEDPLSRDMHGHVEDDARLTIIRLRAALDTARVRLGVPVGVDLSARAASIVERAGAEAKSADVLLANANRLALEVARLQAALREVEQERDGALLRARLLADIAQRDQR
jgi:hypothetical protein